MRAGMVMEFRKVGYNRQIAERLADIAIKGIPWCLPAGRQAIGEGQ